MVAVVLLIPSTTASSMVMNVVEVWSLLLSLPEGVHFTPTVYAAESSPIGIASITIVSNIGLIENRYLAMGVVLSQAETSSPAELCTDLVSLLRL